MQLFHGLVELPGHVDVLLRGQIAPVAHEGLQSVRRQPALAVAKAVAVVVERVEVARLRVFVPVVAG